MTAEMSILGLYNYDDTIFDNMSYPEQFTETDETEFVNNLLLELAELEIIYPNPAFMKFAIEHWSAKELPTWERIYSASLLEYNPIENYDRNETETETVEGERQHSGTDTTTNSGTDTTTNSGTDTTTNSGTDTVTNSGTDTTAHSGTDTVTNSGKDTTQDSGSDSSSGTGSKTSTNSGTDTTTNQIAAYDSNTLATHDTSALAHGHQISDSTTDSTTVTHGKKSELTHGHVEATQHGESIGTTYGHVEATQHGHTEATQHGLQTATQHGLQTATLHGEKIEDDTTRTKTSRIHGNIGVTTSQQMLQQELDIAPKLNIMNIMINSFKNRFCILVY